MSIAMKSPKERKALTRFLSSEDIIEIDEFSSREHKTLRIAIKKDGHSGSDKLFAADFIRQVRENERYQYPRASPGERRRCLLFRPKGLFISPCFPLPRSVMEP